MSNIENSEKAMGKRIQQVRQCLGLSRPKFADLLGVPPTTLKNYELGYRGTSGHMLGQLAAQPKTASYVLWVISGETGSPQSVPTADLNPSF